MHTRSDPTPPTAELLVRALYWLLLLVSLAALATASYEGWMAEALLWPVTLATFAFALVVTIGGWALLSMGTAAFLTTLLLVVQIEVAAVWLRTWPGATFMLMGRGPAFWANVVHLACVVLAGALVVSATRSLILRLLFGVVYAFASLGFAVGVFEGAPLEVTLLGPGPLAYVTDPRMQPAYVALAAVLPFSVLVALLRAFAGLRRGNPELARISAFLAIVASVLVAGGAVLADWANLPSVSWFVKRPVGSGRVELAYSSPWRKGDDGSHQHRITLKTRGRTEGAREVPWSLSASLERVPSAGEPTVLFFGARHAASGVPLAKLMTEELELAEDGKPITGFQLARLPPGSTSGLLALVVDLSPAPADQLLALKRGLRALMDRLPNGWTIALIACGSGARVRGLYHPGEKLLAEIEKPEATGGRAVLEGLFEAHRTLAAREADLKAIVMLAGGPDVASRRSLREAQMEAQRAGIPVHTLGLGAAPNARTLATTDLTGDALVDLARSTGGFHARVDKAADLPRICQQVADHVAVTHRITFSRPPEAAPKPAFVKPAGSAVTTAPLAVEVQAEGRVERMWLSVGGQPVLEDTKPRLAWTAQPGDVVDGTVTVSATAVGRDGAVSTVAKTLSLTAQPMAVEILSPLSGGRVHEPVMARARVRGGTPASVEALLDGVAAPVESKGGEHLVFLSPGALGPGVHAFQVIARDAAGRASTDQVFFHVMISSVEVTMPGFGWGSIVSGPRAFEARVRSVPADVPVTSVTAFVDRRPIATLTDPPYRFVLDGAALAEGGHSVVVRATNALGFAAETATNYRAQKNSVLLHFPRLLQGTSITEKTRLVPKFASGAIVRVEYRIAGKLYVGEAPDLGVVIDPAEHPPGPTRINVRAIQRDGTPVETLVSIDLPRAVELSLPVCARRDGRPMRATDLAALKPRVELDGKAVAPELVRVAVMPDSPLAVGMVVDASADMAAGGTLPGAAEALSRFVEMLRPGDRAALVALSGGARLLAPPSTEHDALMGALARLQAAGSRPLHDGVLEALNALGQARDRQAVLVLSSGEDRTQDGASPGSRSSLDAVLERAQELGTAIHAIGLGPGPRRAGARGERALQKLAYATGGTYRHVALPRMLAPALLSVLDDVQSSARVVVRSPPPGGSMRSVRVDPGRADVVMTYPARIPR